MPVSLDALVHALGHVLVPALVHVAAWVKQAALQQQDLNEKQN